MKATTLARGSETPDSSAATSFSRTRRIARPVRLRKRFAMKKKASPVATIAMSASHMLVGVRLDVDELKSVHDPRAAA